MSGSGKTLKRIIVDAIINEKYPWYILHLPQNDQFERSVYPLHIFLTLVKFRQNGYFNSSALHIPFDPVTVLSSICFSQYCLTIKSDHLATICATLLPHLRGTSWIQDSSFNNIVHTGKETGVVCWDCHPGKHRQSFLT